MTKLTIIGAGSAVFTRRIVTDLLAIEQFKNMEIALQDIDPVRLKASHDLIDVISKKLQKIDLVSKGDDYQILFTASKKKSRIIKRTFKSLGIKISKIGNISSGGQKSQIIDEKGNKIAIKNKGHFHNF